MNRRGIFAISGLVVLAFICAPKSYAEPSREEVQKAWIGTWVGDWQAADGSAAGKVRLVVHSNKNGNCNAVITFLSGATGFGEDPFIPQATEGGVTPDYITILGARNGASFTLGLRLMANGVELLAEGGQFVTLPNELRAQLIKQ